MKTYKFKDVSLLITHYNRSESLERLLKAFESLRCTFNQIVVSDDGSDNHHLIVLNRLKDSYKLELVTSERNKGLGHNINKGQFAVNSPLTLYVQEDFIPTDNFPVYFNNALSLYEEKGDIDIIRFYAYSKYPYLKPYKLGFSEMYIKPWCTNYRKIYYYSDHPHLRNSNFLEKFGKYAEGIKGDRTEYRMCLAFIQNGGKGLFLNDFQSMFVQKNSDSEPSTMTRTSLTRSNNRVISAIRYIYRQVKYNYDINFFRS